MICISFSKLLISSLWIADFRLNLEPLTLTTRGFTRGRLGLSIFDSANNVIIKPDENLWLLFKA